MASPGGVFNESVVVQQPPEDVMRQLVAATAGVTGYSASSAGTNSLILVRKYWPTWVIVVAIIGTLLILIGLLALLIRNTETLTIGLAKTPEGTRIDVSGVASHDMINRLQTALAQMREAPAADLTVGSAESDTKVCPQCAETIKSAAVVCRYCGYKFEN